MGEGLVRDSAEACGDVAVSGCPEGMARFRSVAMFSGPCPVRIFGAPSVKVVSRTKCSRFSITHCDRAGLPIGSGDAPRAVRSMSA